MMHILAGLMAKTHVNFGVVLEGGPGGPLEKWRSNDAGSAALASASCGGTREQCGSNSDTVWEQQRLPT